MLGNWLMGASSEVEVNAPRVGGDKLLCDNTGRRWSPSAFEK